MRLLRLCETNRLHYGKYLYKLVLLNPLHTIFRSDFQKKENLGFAREHLDRLTSDYRVGEPLLLTYYRTSKEISIEHYLDAKDVYSVLKQEKEYKIRVDQGQKLLIYSNDKAMLLKINSKMRKSVYEFWEPKDSNINSLLSEKNIIFVKTKPQFPLRVTFNGTRVPSTFANWLENNTDKARVGDKTLSTIKEYQWCDGSYFHVRDEKVLQLVEIQIAQCIRRVDKLIYNADIDK